MDLEDAARQSGVIPHERVASLVTCLKAPDFDWLLAGPHSTQSRLQGDLLSDSPWLWLIAMAPRDANRLPFWS